MKVYGGSQMKYSWWQSYCQAAEILVIENVVLRPTSSSESLLKYRILRPALVLVKQNPHFNKVPMWSGWPFKFQTQQAKGQEVIVDRILGHKNSNTQRHRPLWDERAHIWATFLFREKCRYITTESFNYQSIKRETAGAVRGEVKWTEEQPYYKASCSHWKK